MSHNTNSPIIIYADGAISPERAGVGVVVRVEPGHVILLANRLLQALTSNEAEYAGLIMALEIAAQMNAPRTEIRLDSEVVVNQMNGRFAVNSRLLKPWHQLACERARQIQGLSYTHIPRTHNAVAHSLAAEAVAGRRWRTKGAPCSG